MSVFLIASQRQALIDYLYQMLSMVCIPAVGITKNVEKMHFTFVSFKELQRRQWIPLFLDTLLYRFHIVVENTDSHHSLVSGFPVHWTEDYTLFRNLIQHVATRCGLETGFQLLAQYHPTFSALRLEFPCKKNQRV